VETAIVRLADLQPDDPRPLLDEERSDLLVLLRSMSDSDWVAPTEAGHWRVKDVALHLLDDDLGWLARGRDGDLSGLLPVGDDHGAFVRSLDDKNERWVAGAAGLSRSLVADLLEWSGAQVATWHATLDLAAPSRVMWASDGEVPLWFDLCRDLTERWVHQRQIRDAVGQPGLHDRFLGPVLRTFVWAVPHQFRAEAPVGTIVAVDLGVGGSWVLERGVTGWELREAVEPEPAALLAMSSEAAWRQLTGLPAPEGEVTIHGDERLGAGLLDVRGIIV
jgi:uncharacterized protein (TIGR03083 family)